jgi:C1A family cysteine protease
MPGTVGELREALKELGDQAWPIAAHLKDMDALPEHALGADLAQQPLAVDAPAVDFSKVLEAPVPSPLLRARRLQVTQLQVMAELAPPPSAVDWRDRWGGRWLATIQDQNPCESCWAFGATALVESMVRIEHGVWAKRSEGDVRDGWGGKLGEDWRKRDGIAPCAHGAGVDGALDWIVANGIADPDCFPWASSDRDYAPTADRTGRAVRVGMYEPLGDITDQKRWLDTVGPIVASFDEYNDFDAYGGGGIVYRKISMATFRAGHTLLIVGYDDNQQCWIIRNSWGSGWGDDGYGLFGYGECKIDTFTKYGTRGTSPDPWTRRRLHNGCFIESSNGEMHRNFELVRSSAPRARHLWRQGGEGGDFSWHDAGTLENPNDIAAGAGAIGMPALTSTTYGRNFETVYWEASGWLRHWWYDQTATHWVDAGRFGSAETAGFPGFIQSSYGAPGNFEVGLAGRSDTWTCGG